MNPEERQGKLAELKSHVLLFSEPNDFLAWRSLFITFLYEALAISLIWQESFSLLGWAIHTLNAVRFFIQFHDMAHFSFFKSIQLNKFFGKLIGIYVHFPFNAWRDGHNHHHKHFGNLDRMDLSQTILFTKKQFEDMPKMKKILTRIFREPIIFFTISAPFVWFVLLFASIFKRYGFFSWTYFQKIMSVLLYLVILPYFGVPRFELCFSIYVADMMGTILFHLQHSVNRPYRERKGNWDFTKAALQGSTFLYIPYIFRPFTNGIQYHHIHHLNTSIASYVIDSCHQQFQNRKGKKMNWDDFEINRVQPWHALKSMMNVMLDEENGILVPFSYS